MNIFYIHKKKNSLLSSSDKATPANPSQEDIYLVEFPKSGITFLSFILANIELQLSGRYREQATFFNLPMLIPDMHYTMGLPIRRWAARTFIKSHTTYNQSYRFVIYLIRHPEAVMVSYYNFIQHMGHQISFSDFLRHPKWGIAAWVRHLESWLDYALPGNRIHIVLYEDLIQDTQHTIRQLYNNLGVMLPDDILEKAIKQSSLESMKASEEFYRQHHPNYRMSFVGKEGKISSQDLLTPENKDFIYQIADKWLKRFYANT